jgi:hypothetical protein
MTYLGEQVRDMQLNVRRSYVGLGGMVARTRDGECSRGLDSSTGGGSPAASFASLQGKVRDVDESRGYLYIFYKAMTPISPIRPPNISLVHVASHPGVHPYPYFNVSHVLSPVRASPSPRNIRLGLFAGLGDHLISHY